MNPTGEFDWDVAVIGAGAAGLTAGIAAAEARPGARVVLLDGATRIGAKILVAGGGRCNVTHDRVDPRDYNASSRSFVKNVLSSFTADDTVAWMASLGVELKREPTGKLFPTTDKARTVLDALLGRLEEVGAVLKTGHRVRGIGKLADGFLVQSDQGGLKARRIILATGGRSLPRTGSDGAGYGLVRSLGHTVTETHPALVSMVLQQHFFHANLAGISHEAQLTTLADAKIVDQRRGEMLWTHFGLSGPLIMDASRHWLANKQAGKEVTWVLNLLPDERFETLEAGLLHLGEESPRLNVRRALEQHSLPEKVLTAIIEWSGVAPETQLAQLKREDRRRLLNGIVALVLPVEQERGWNYAEVTAGGVPLSEVTWKTMESRLTPGLHLAGEILDLDGRIGGFNFQWAWATGRLAGRAAVGGGR